MRDWGKILWNIVEGAGIFIIIVIIVGIIFYFGLIFRGEPDLWTFADILKTFGLGSLIIVGLLGLFWVLGVLSPSKFLKDK